MAITCLQLDKKVEIYHNGFGVIEKGILHSKEKKMVLDVQDCQFERTKCSRFVKLFEK
jgi:hypothetical protein